MTTSNTARMGALYEEHVLLGAKFTDSCDGSHIRACAYPSEDTAVSEGKTFGDGVYIHDLTGSTYLLVSGADARALIEAAFCGPKLRVGECAWQAALTAEGALTSVALVARTGDEEYVLIDPSLRGEVVYAWLTFLAAIEQDGYAPYANARIEDASGMLVPVLMAGEGASRVLADYVPTPKDLPAQGQVKNVLLDKIQAVCIRVPASGLPGHTYVALVPEARARILWRSFLSFNEVRPLGCEALLRAMGRYLPWGEVLFETDQVKPGGEKLCEWGLLRDTMDFVGSRALA